MIKLTYVSGATLVLGLSKIIDITRGADADEFAVRYIDKDGEYAFARVSQYEILEAGKVEVGKVQS